MKKQPKESPEIILAKAVVPKPTKHEVIDALAQLQRAKMAAARREIDERRDKLSREIIADMRAHVVENVASLTSSMVRNFSYSRPDVRVDLLNLSSALARKIATFRAITLPSVPDLSVLRTQIRQRMESGNPGERVAKLIADPETKAALETMLAEISKPAVPALTNAQ